jgi:hypothetical protein
MGKDETMRTRDKTRLENAVKRGVAWLDANPEKVEAFEHWHEAINVNYLAMSNGSYCIVGQLMGGYSLLRRVDDFGSKYDDDQMNRWAARHGFYVVDRYKRVQSYWRPDAWTYDVDTEWRDEAYAYLNALWSEVVTTRQLARSLPESHTGADDEPLSYRLDPVLDEVF